MKLELVKYDNANCLEATFINEDIIIHCQAYADIQIDLLKEDCLKFGVKLNKEQLALIKEVENNIVLPTQEEIEEKEAEIAAQLENERKQNIYSQIVALEAKTYRPLREQLVGTEEEKLNASIILGEFDEQIKNLRGQL